MVWLKQVFCVALCSCVPIIQAICFFNITSVDCLPSKIFCTMSLCNFTLTDQFTMAINEIGCTLTQDVAFPKLRLKHEVKIGANKYGPGMFDHLVEICELANGFSVPVLSLFVPKKNLDEILHVCPYKKKEVLALRGFSFSTRNLPVAFQSGEYRLTFSVRKGKFAETFVMKIYGHLCVA